MRIRPLLLLLAVLGFAGISHAQTTVSGHVVGANSSPTANRAFIRFRLQNFAGNVPRLNGTGACAVGAVLPFVVDVTPNGTGAISQVICGNDVITPETCGVSNNSPCTFYTVEWWYQGMVQYAWNFSIIGSSFNLDIAVPLSSTPPPAPPPIAGGGGSCGTLAVNQILFGTSPATCAVSPQFTYVASTNHLNLISTTLGAGVIDAGINLGGSDGTSFAILYDRRTGSAVPEGLNIWYNTSLPSSADVFSISNKGQVLINPFASSAAPGEWIIDPDASPVTGATATISYPSVGSSGTVASRYSTATNRNADWHDIQDGSGAIPYKIDKNGGITVNPTVVGPIASTSLAIGGTGYAVNDTGTFLVSNTGTGATYIITSVSGGVVTGYTVTAAGTGYAVHVASGVVGGAQPGVGTGFSIFVLTITATVAPAGMNSNAYQTSGIPFSVYLDQNFTTTSASLVAITGSTNNLSWTMPANIGINFPVSCYLTFQTTGAGASVALGVQDVTVAPTNAVFTGSLQISNASIPQGTATFTSTTATQVVGITAGTGATKWTGELHGFIEQPSNASTSVVNIMADISGGQTLTIFRDSYCRLN
jgi:hypothetical protein